MARLELSEDFCVGYGSQVVAQCRSPIRLVPGGKACTITLLCGANGSGKTTLLRTLSGSLRPVRGTAQLDGLPLPHQSSRGNIFYLGSHLDFLEHLTARDIVRSLTTISRAELIHWGDHLQLALKTPFKELSTGNKQKVRFLIALFSMQKALLSVLDEPFTGFDLETRGEAMNLLAKLFPPSGSRRLLISLHTEQMGEGWCDTSLQIHQGEIWCGPGCRSVYEARREVLAR